MTVYVLSEYTSFADPDQTYLRGVYSSLEAACAAARAAGLERWDEDSLIHEVELDAPSRECLVVPIRIGQ